MPTTIPSARTWLYDQLVALQGTTLAGVHVARSGIWKDTPEKDTIEVLNARAPTFTARRLGALQYDEEYTIPVRVAVTGPEGDLEVVEDRLWDLVTIIAGLVITEHRLGGLVQQAQPGASDDEASGPMSEGGDFATFTLNVDVLAHVNLAA